MIADQNGVRRVEHVRCHYSLEAFVWDVSMTVDQILDFKTFFRKLKTINLILFYTLRKLILRKCLALWGFLKAPLANSRH